MSDEMGLELKRTHDELIAEYIHLAVKRDSVAKELCMTCNRLACSGGYTRPDGVTPDEIIDNIKENAIVQAVFATSRLGRANDLAQGVVDNLREQSRCSQDLRTRCALAITLLRGMGCDYAFVQVLASKIEQAVSADKEEADHE